MKNEAAEVEELHAHLVEQTRLAVDVLNGMIAIAEMEQRHSDARLQELRFYRSDLQAQLNGSRFIPDDRQETLREPTPFGRTHNFGVR